MTSTCTPGVENAGNDVVGRIAIDDERQWEEEIEWKQRSEPVTAYR